MVFLCIIKIGTTFRVHYIIRLRIHCTIEFFTVYTKLAEMALLASKDLTTVKKQSPVGLDLIQEIITGL